MLFVRHDKGSHMAVVKRPTGPPVRLVIADVDGALLPQEKVLTALADEAVRKLRTASIAFTITSRRRSIAPPPRRQSPHLFREEWASDFERPEGPFH